MNFFKKTALMMLTAVMLLSSAACDSGSGRGSIKETECLNGLAAKEKKDIKEVDLYFDTGNGMAGIAKQANFKNVANVVNSINSEIALTYNDDSKSVDYKIMLCDVSGSKESDSDEFTSYISGQGEFSTDKAKVFDSNIANFDPDNLSVMITDLASQLDDDYVKVAENIVKNTLKNDMALAFISVYDFKDNENNKPYFIIATGNNDVVSEFVTKVKKDRTISDLMLHTDNTFEENATDTVNYEIFAKNNGINGIKYSDIKFIENGIVYDKDITTGQYKYKDNGEVATIPETKGSFSDVNENFDSTNYLTIVEGTVNFDPGLSNEELESNRLVRFAESKKKSGDRERVDSKDIRYLAAAPLTSNSGNDIAGKLKLDIPFSIIDGVKLSLIDCNIKTDIFYVDTKAGEFKPFKGNTDIDTSIAEGVDELQGKWRIDDKNNSLTFNIGVPHLNKLFKDIKEDTPFIKLNVYFEHFKNKDYLPQWVLDLSDSSKPDGVRINNLQKLFDYIYDYQRTEDIASNGFTIYIKNPDVSVSTERTRGDTDDRGNNEENENNDREER